MKKLENGMEELVTGLWTLLHDQRRLTRKQDDGSFESRIKTTDDLLWIEKNGITELDIANTLYVDLPEDRKYENKASAEVAMKQIYQAIKDDKELDDTFVEESSAIVHKERLSRNDWVFDEKYGSPILTKDYVDLPEEEKEKDRVIVKMAIDLYEEHK